ncbi:MAG: HAD family hydrolase [Verrucomicrobia bacterium]|nr:MAG: HAD family hydrolase [Verrucomicrobiota bacterium]
MLPSLKLIIFDCDSTLSAIEGIDELGRRGGPALFAQIEAMTHDAMNGKLAVEAVFGERLRLIRPSAADVAVVGQHYIETVEPTALATLAALRAEGWTPLILSGGFRNAIRPLADFLAIKRVEAVDLYFDSAGAYAGFDEAYPATRSGGKPELIRKLKAELSPAHIVMVGDGVSDLETTPEVDLFIGFGRYVAREKVRNRAEAFVFSLADVPPLLGRWRG